MNWRPTSDTNYRKSWTFIFHYTSECWPERPSGFPIIYQIYMIYLHHDRFFFELFFLFSVHMYLPPVSLKFLRENLTVSSTTSVEPKQRRFVRVEKKKARNFFPLSISDTIKVSPFLLSSDSLVSPSHHLSPGLYVWYLFSLFVMARKRGREVFRWAKRLFLCNV